MKKSKYEVNNMNHQKGEALNVGFDGSDNLEFHGAKVTSECNARRNNGGVSLNGLFLNR